MHYGTYDFFSTCQRLMFEVGIELRTLPSLNMASMLADLLIGLLESQSTSTLCITSSHLCIAIRIYRHANIRFAGWPKPQQVSQRYTLANVYE